MRPLAPEYDLDRLQKNDQIEKGTGILYIVQIELQLVTRILDGRAIRV